MTGQILQRRRKLKGSVSVHRLMQWRSPCLLGAVRAHLQKELFLFFDVFAILREY